MKKGKYKRKDSSFKALFLEEKFAFNLGTAGILASYFAGKAQLFHLAVKNILISRYKMLQFVDINKFIFYPGEAAVRELSHLPGGHDARNPKS